MSAIQRIELHDRHLYVNWGSVPDWLAGLGAFAAFGVLFLALHEWRAAQCERRDREGDQARLIIPEGVGGGKFVIRNHSQAPVFNVDCFSEMKSKTIRSAEQHEWFHMTLRTPVLRPGEATAPYVSEDDEEDKNADAKNVQGKKATAADYLVVPVGELATITFTDAHGRPWRRLGSGQPIRDHTQRPVATSLEDLLKTIKFTGKLPTPPPPTDWTP
ncbi:hypothetical protein P5V47_08790 [Mycobacteroides abscessus subsp. massiliense]|uniref:hypothetical protein n=1 Tax=Mycobacteroides abscessus TaxID=36809 RepID=UPI00266BEFFF|nr:hypothetical protein [Mycobacteroides abscessus]MDO3298788.1 hypothetical protein [Mycobacteroides abscessus subsp. massiliense]